MKAAKEAGYPLPSGAKGGKYAVEYRGCVFHADDTRELVELVQKIAHSL